MKLLKDTILLIYQSFTELFFSGTGSKRTIEWYFGTGKNNIKIGILFCILILVSVISYTFATNNNTGGAHLLALMAIAILMPIITSVAAYKSSNASMGHFFKYWSKQIYLSFMITFFIIFFKIQLSGGLKLRNDSQIPFNIDNSEMVQQIDAVRIVFYIYLTMFIISSCIWYSKPRMALTVFTLLFIMILDIVTREYELNPSDEMRILFTIGTLLTTIFAYGFPNDIPPEDTWRRFMLYFIPFISMMLFGRLFGKPVILVSLILMVVVIFYDMRTKVSNDEDYEEKSMTMQQVLDIIKTKKQLR